MADALMCSAHGKKRTAQNLIDDGAGGMCCAPGNECQTGGAGGFGGAGDGGMMAGDWYCPACGDHQFARNTECRKCGGPNPGSGKGGGKGAAQSWGGGNGADMMNMMMSMMGGMGKGGGKAAKGGWGNEGAAQWGTNEQEYCSVHGKKRTTQNLMDDGAGGWCCKPGFECNAGAGGGAGVPGGVVPGDWMCPACGDHQFARNTACRKCGAEKPEGGDEGGDTAGAAWPGMKELMHSAPATFGVVTKGGKGKGKGKARPSPF